MLAEWRAQMSRLAQQPNVFVKVGGIGYKSFVEDHILHGPRTSEVLADYWRPEILFCFETFGVERCMLETNYPEDTFLTDFVVLWNTYKLIAEEMSAAEREWVFAEAARQLYSL